MILLLKIKAFLGCFFLLLFQPKFYFPFKYRIIMKRHSFQSIAFLVFIFLSAIAVGQIPTPKEFFGFTPGDDRQMFTYEKMMEYIKLLDQQSPMLHIEQSGTTEMGKPMYIVFISSAENIANLDRLQEINRQLALDEIEPGKNREDIIGEGKVFFLSTLSMHASEVGPVQAFPLVAYELLTGGDPRRELILDNTVAMFIPHNPDGMNMIVEHYNKHKGTPMETSSMPGVYHKYVGHNINRDFVTLWQSENQLVADVYSTQWFPQAMVERHQMGSYGPRFFISPPHDPIAENVDAGIWNWMRVYGSRTLTEMTNAGIDGVSVNYLFDDYWPGATTTSIWKGVIGMLSEAASVNIATPIYVEPNEFRTIGKGLGEYAKGINLPSPWKGGWWHLADIVNMELENTLSYLNTSALYREEILFFRNDITKREIERGREEAPYYYVLPEKQHDASEMVNLVNLLHRHGVKSFALTDAVTMQNRQFEAGDVVIPLNQPYRAFIKEVMESQKFPARHYTPDGELIKPYDITSWSLPLHRGVESVEINDQKYDLTVKLEPLSMPYDIKKESVDDAQWAVFSGNHNETYKALFLALEKGLKAERANTSFSLGEKSFPAGTVLIRMRNGMDEVLNQLVIDPTFLVEKPTVETTDVSVPQIAIVETWNHDMDGGWLRFVFDEYHIPYKVLRPFDLQTEKLTGNFDILFFSDQPKSVFMTGKYERSGQSIPSRYPPDYVKGMEKKGLANVLSFVNDGGKVMAWGPAIELFTGVLSIGEDDDKEEFMLPISDISKGLTAKGLYVPGSLIRVKLMQDHPLTFGMPSELGVFHRGAPVFQTSIPYFDMDRRVIARFPPDNLLMSGYAEHEELMENNAALVWLSKGKGQIILSSFNPQFRASTPVTFKLIFNALFL